MQTRFTSPMTLLCWVATSLLLLLQTERTEATLRGGGTAAGRTTTAKDNATQHHDYQQQEERLLENSILGGATCLGSCSPNPNRGGECYDLTQDVKGQSGTLWFDDPFDVSGPFQVQARIYVGNKEGGGDGMAFVIQPNSANEYPETGSGGGGLGYKTIPNAFAAEIDTYKDGTFLNDHLELKYTSPSWTSISRVALGSDIESKNQEMLLDIEWTAEISPGHSNFFVRLDDEGILEAELSSISEYLGGSTTAYFGFTAATGARHNLHYVCPLSIDGGEFPSASPSEAPSTPMPSTSLSPSSQPSTFPSANQSEAPSASRMPSTSLNPSLQPSASPSTSPSKAPSASRMPSTSLSPFSQPSTSTSPSTSNFPTSSPECWEVGTGFCAGSGGDGGHRLENYCLVGHTACNVDSIAYEQSCEDQCRERQECIGYVVRSDNIRGCGILTSCHFFVYLEEFPGFNDPNGEFDWCNDIELDASIGEYMRVEIRPSKGSNGLGDIVGVVDENREEYTCHQCGQPSAHTKR